MTATLMRVFHEQETASEHVRNALQLLRLGQDPAAIDDRLTAALEKIEATELRATEAEARIAAAIDLDGARLGEIDSLREELRERMDYLAGFQLLDTHPHIQIDWDAPAFTVERHFKREYGTYESWPDAVAMRARLMAQSQVLPFADRSNRTKPQRALGAGSLVP